MSSQNIDKGKFKVCLEFHIGNCKGGCEGYETAENYQIQVNAIREILKGNFKESLKDFKSKMQEFAANMQFEEAQKIKEKIEVLENYQSRSTVLNPKISNIDVFSIVSDETMAYINFLQMCSFIYIRFSCCNVEEKKPV